MDIEAIRARLAAATPGPWKASQGSYNVVVLSPLNLITATCSWCVDESNIANAALIAHAPADLAALLAAHDDLAAQLAAAQAEAARLRAALGDICESVPQDARDVPPALPIAATALSAPSPDAARGAALLAVVAAAERYLDLNAECDVDTVVGTRDWRDVADPCAGIASGDGECHWCELRRALNTLRRYDEAAD